MTNDYERYNFWNIEMEQYLKDIKKEKEKEKGDSQLKVIRNPKELDDIINYQKSFNKGTKIRKIFGEENPILKGYVVFEDNWICEFDKVLFNNKGDIYLVLDFKEIKENVLFPYKNVWKEQKFSCVKLDKCVNVGDVLFVKK